jgi:hypothetical protein
VGCCLIDAFLRVNSSSVESIFFCTSHPLKIRLISWSWSSLWLDVLLGLWLLYSSVILNNDEIVEEEEEISKASSSF